MNSYVVRIVREAGTNLTNGLFEPEEDELLVIEAINEHQAYVASLYRSKLVFRGQIRTTYIDGLSYSNPHL